MSHEHRQHPERFYDDEGEAYEDYDVLDHPGTPVQWELATTNPYRPPTTAQRLTSLDRTRCPDHGRRGPCPDCDPYVFSQS